MSKPEQAFVELKKGDGVLTQVPVVLKWSKRARHIRLSVGSAGKIALTVPPFCSYEQAFAFLESKKAWLAAKLSDQVELLSLREHLDRRPEVSVLGERLHVVFEESSHENSLFYSVAQKQVVLRLLKSEDEEAAIYDLLRQLAAAVIPPRVKTLAGNIGVRVKRVSVRNQSSRWGSCSTLGTVSLNWRLILLSPALQDHVIYHELAHVTEMNHSPRFWALLESYDPQTSIHNEVLKEEGRRLIHLGRSVS